MKKGKKCSQAIWPTLCDSELFQRSASVHFFWLFLALQNVGKFKKGSQMLYFPSIWLQELKRCDVETNPVRGNVEITPKPV